MSTSCLLLPCTRHQRPWRSTLHPRLLCFKRQRQWWRTLLPRLPCPKRRRQVRSFSPLQAVHSFSLSHQRLQMQRHTSRLSLAPRVKGIETPTYSLSRRRLVDEAGHVRDVQVEPWSTSGDAQKRERNSWRGLCYISVMSCSRAQVMGIR